MGTPHVLAISATLLLAVPAAGSPADLEQTAVFVSGPDGYHTYRIPSLIATKKGLLLAFCEARKKSAGDVGYFSGIPLDDLMALPIQIDLPV
jgi:sialidase-1